MEATTEEIRNWKKNRLIAEGIARMGIRSDASFRSGNFCDCLRHTDATFTVKFLLASSRPVVRIIKTNSLAQFSAPSLYLNFFLNNVT